MKTLKFLTLTVVIVCFVSCKYNEDQKTMEKEAVVEIENVTELPNKSDIAFYKAFDALNKKDYRTAGEHVAHGTQELTAEAKTRGLVFKDQFNTSIKHLTDIANELQTGGKVNEEALRNLIANAEINVNHEYLMSNNEFVMMTPEKVNEARLRKSFDHNLMSLEKGMALLEGNAKKESKQLQAEGKKLKDEFEAWNERVQEHTKKAEEHFKKYQPENVYTWGLYPLQ